MTSKVKILGLALLAIAAMSMVAASAAQAALGELHAKAGPAIITGEQSAGTQHVFKLLASGVETKCTQALIEGTIQGGGVAGQTTVTEATTTAQYTGCQTLFGAGATIDMNGCKYTITGGVAEKTATVDITGCTPTKPHILITSQLGCTVTVPEQTGPNGQGLSHLTFTNIEGTPKHVQDHATVTNIKYEFTGVFCPEATNVFHQDGTYTGTTTLKAFVDSAVQQQITHNGHQFTRHVCGNQVDLFAT